MTFVWDDFMMLGFFVVLTLLLALRPKDFPMSRPGIAVCLTLMLIFGYIGGKFLNMLLHLGSYGHLNLSFWGWFRTSGKAFPGALTFELLVALAFAKLRFRRISFLKVMDFVMPILLLQQVFHRMGCFYNSCCYGRPTDLPWGVIFEDETAPRHPTQIYELMYVLVIFFVMRHIYKKGRQPTGVVFCGTLFLYASVRFFNEFLRVDSVPVLGPITLAQATMLCVAAATWLAMGRLSKRGKR